MFHAGWLPSPADARGTAPHELPKVVFRDQLGLGAACLIIGDTLGTAALDSARALHGPGHLDHARGRPDATEASGRRAVEVRRANVGNAEPRVAAGRAALAAILADVGCDGRAEALLRDAVAVFERVHGPNDHNHHREPQPHPRRRRHRPTLLQVPDPPGLRGPAETTDPTETADHAAGINERKHLHRPDRRSHRRPGLAQTQQRRDPPYHESGKSVLPMRESHGR